MDEITALQFRAASEACAAERATLALSVELRLDAASDLDTEHWTGHRREHQIAGDALDRRLDDMNALREQVTEERGSYVAVAAYETRHEDVRRRLQILENQIANYQGRFWMLATLPGVLVVAVNFILYYLSRH